MSRDYVGEMRAPWPGPTHPTGPAGLNGPQPSGPPPQPSGPKLVVDLTLQGDDADREYELSVAEDRAAMSDAEYEQLVGTVDELHADLVLLVLATLVDDVRRQLRAPLALLVAAVVEDDDYTPADRWHLDAAAKHVSLALSRLARIESPARRDLPRAAVGRSAVATTGGPVQPPDREVRGGANISEPVGGEESTSGSAAATRSAVRESSGGAENAAGAGADFRLPRDIRVPAGSTDGLPPTFPGSPPGPPPRPDPKPSIGVDVPRCDAPTSAGPCDLMAGHPVGPWWLEFSGHLPAITVYLPLT